MWGVFWHKLLINLYLSYILCYIIYNMLPKEEPDEIMNPVTIANLVGYIIHLICSYSVDLLINEAM